MNDRLLHKPQYTPSVAPKRPATPEPKASASATDISPGNPSREREKGMWDNMLAGARSQGESSGSQNSQSSQLPIQTALTPAPSNAAERQQCQQNLGFGAIWNPQLIQQFCTYSGFWQLTTDEINYARQIFGNSIDYSQIRIAVDDWVNVVSGGRSVTLGNLIHLQSVWDGHQVFERDGRTLTAAGRELLIHEMTHIWQFQTVGWGYALNSGQAQLDASLRGRGYDGAYHWREAHGKLPWEKWNAEQQASAIQEYSVILEAINNKKATANDLNTFGILQQYRDLVVNKKGAATWP